MLRTKYLTIKYYSTPEESLVFREYISKNGNNKLVLLSVYLV